MPQVKEEVLVFYSFSYIFLRHLVAKQLQETKPHSWLSSQQHPVLMQRMWGIGQFFCPGGLLVSYISPFLLK